MPAFIDHPRPGVPFDPEEFWINGWLWLDQQHAQLAAIEAWHNDTFLGTVDVNTLILRPDVSARYDIPTGVRTGFAFAARYPNAPTGPFGLALRGRLRDGSLTEPVVTSEVTPPSPDHDPLGVLRTQLPPSGRGLEIGAHTRPVKGLTPYFADAVASFAGTGGRVDFLADALALPLADDTLDYLCSSHVLEHMPNPLAALHEWHRVLRPGGWLYLVVPDKRYTFDVGRPVTPVKHLLRDFVNGAPAADSSLHVEEFVYQTDWGRLRPDCPEPDRPAQQAAAHKQYLAAIERGEPIDIHYHTFTPESLQELLCATGFIGGRRARFELVMQAERYPPDRIDGIALLLRKRERERDAPSLSATFVLHHVNASVPPLPLLCPVSLEPLRLESKPNSTPALVANRSGRLYPHQASLPALVPPPDARPKRSWNRLCLRIAQHLSASLRLAFPPDSAGKPAVAPSSSHIAKD